MKLLEPFRPLATSLSWKIGKFFITERVITLLTRVIDLLTIGLIFGDPSIQGALKAFVFITPVNLIFCMGVVYVLAVFARNGYDLSGLEELKQMRHEQYSERQRIKRLLQWILRRRETIFWIGSWFFLDPDYVTILLYDRTKSFTANIVTITVPSVVLAMIIWVPLYWIFVNALIGGYRWAAWFLD